MQDGPPAATVRPAIVSVRRREVGPEWRSKSQRWADGRRGESGRVRGASVGENGTPFAAPPGFRRNGLGDWTGPIQRGERARGYRAGESRLVSAVALSIRSSDEAHHAPAAACC